MPRGRLPRDIAEQRLEKLLSIAFDEFARHGFGATSLNRLVELSGVSKTTIFRRFGSKEGLFVTLIERSAADLRRATANVTVSQDDPRAYLLAVSRAMAADAYGPGSGLLRLAIAEHAQFPYLSEVVVSSTERTFRPLARFFAALMKKGILREADPAELCYDFLSLVTHGFLFMLVDKDKVFVEERLARVVDRFLSGWSGAESRAAPQQPLNGSIAAS